MRDFLSENRKKAINLCLAVILLAAWVWNYSELTFEHTPYACSFLQNMGIVEIAEACRREGVSSIRLLAHSAYHNMEDSSLKNASSFFALLALIVALLQSMYPYQLGKLYDFPIRKLDPLPKLEFSTGKLIFLAAVSILAELFRLYIVEITAILLGYGIIAWWIYRLVRWYKNYETPEKMVCKLIGGQVEELLGMGDKRQPGECEQIRRVLEQVTEEDGAEERRIIEAIPPVLYGKRQELSGGQRGRIFEISFYFSWLSVTAEAAEKSWRWRQLKGAMACADFGTKAGEAFIMGTLCGCLAGNDAQVIKNCVCETLKDFKKDPNVFLAVSGVLAVFLELYCSVSDEILDAADLMIEEGCFAPGVFLSQVEECMGEYYSFMIESELLDPVEDYHVIRALVEEFENENDKIPETLLGSLLICPKRE